MFVLILSQKKLFSANVRSKKAIPGAWSQVVLVPKSDSDVRLRCPTPTPSPSNWVFWAEPNNSSMIQPDLCTKADRDWLRRAGNRTIVPKLGKPDGQRTGTFASKRTIVRLRARPHQEQAGPRSEQSQKSATFLRRPACWAGHPERTIIRFPTRLVKKRTKKPGQKPWRFPNNPPFYVISSR